MTGINSMFVCGWMGLGKYCYCLFMVCGVEGMGS